MVDKIIEIPDFNFSSFYYPQILEALIQYKRRNVPELTDESEFEPFIQLLRSQALVGHLNNVLLDLAANESMLPTAKLVDSVRNILRAIDYRLAPATPANVEIVYKLAKVFTSPFRIIPEGAQVATVRQASEAAITYEANAPLDIDRTDKFGRVTFYWASQDAWIDHTTAANDNVIGSTINVFPFMAVGDAAYFCHSQVMWDKMLFDESTGGGSGYVAIWEYYDGDWAKTQPKTVTQTGNTLKINCNSLLGTNVRAKTNVRVTLNENGNFENAESLWDGVTNYVLIGLLGQSNPSLEPSDYTIGSDWSELVVLKDETNFLALDGVLEFELPQSLESNWIPATIGPPAGLYTGYCIRLRIVSVFASQTPVLSNAHMDNGKQYVIRRVTQGQLAADDPLGSSTGLPDQRHQTSRDYFIVGTMTVTVDGEAWVEVDNFFSSTASDKHYVVELGANDRATIVFGSGTQGKIPPIGINNISAEYRFGADNDGNVGPKTITVDKTGLSFVDSLFNPRQASGWKEAEGSTPASLQRAKIAGPASIRVREVALGPDDVTWMATKKYKTPEGSNPYSRALAIEEGLGPKTVELVLVKKGGTLSSADELDDITEYFNGKPPNIPKKIVANQQMYAFNYAQRVIDIQAVVTVDNVAEQEIVNHLRQTIQPEATREDGVTWEWDFGSLVPRSRLIHEIFNTDQNRIFNVVLIHPNADILLGKRELPIVGSISITVKSI